MVQRSAEPENRYAVFAAPADDPRARRTADVFILVASSVVVLLAAWAHRAETDLDQRVTAFFAEGVPEWLSAVATMIYIVGGIFVVGLIAAVWIFGDGRRAVARDMILAALLSLVVATVSSLLLGPEWPDVIPELIERDGIPSFPLVRLVFAVAVIAVASPYLSVPMRRVGQRLVVPMALSAIVLGYASVSSVIGGIAAGLVAAAAIHLVFGSGVGIPSKARIAGAFRTIDVDEASLTYPDVQPIGATLANGSLADGTRLKIKVYGRDAADAAVVSRVWRRMWFTDANRTLTASGLQQVEHEGLMLLEGARAGAHLPELVAWDRGEAGDAVIATAGLAHDTLSDRPDIDDATLDQCWDALRRLQEAGIAHRALDGSRIILADSQVIIDDLADAAISPDAATMQADVAQMLVATSLAAGNERAIAAAQRSIGDDGLADAIQLLQRGALSTALYRDVREAKLKLKDLRAQVADATDTEVPELAQLQRVSWGNVAMVVLTVFAASTLISSLADVGFDTIIDELSNARWGWLAVAFITAQLTNVGEWLSLSGMIGRPAPFAPTIMFRYAISFISLAVPSEAGAIALTVRYMQRLGVSAAAAVAQSPALTVISKTVDILLLIITSRIIGQTVNLDELDGGPALRILLLAGIAIVIGTVLTLTVPKLRARVLPPIRDGFSAVRGALTDPQRLLQICTGTVAQRLLHALTLAAAVSAFGSSISFSEAIFVNSAVTLFVGLMPVPGGIGVAEAAFTAGLTVVGVPEGAAIAAALSHRIVMSYLPPIYGWYTTRWLRNQDYL